MQCLDLVLQSFIPGREFQVSERKYTGTLGPASVIMYIKLMKPTSELKSCAEDGCQQRKLHLSWWKLETMMVFPKVLTASLSYFRFMVQNPTLSTFYNETTCEMAPEWMGHCECMELFSGLATHPVALNDLSSRAHSCSCVYFDVGCICRWSKTEKKRKTNCNQASSATAFEHWTYNS